jgi:hypothetical protein
MGQTWHGWAGETASFVDAKNGYSLADLQQDGTRVLSLTTDGGDNWREVRQVAWPGAPGLCGWRKRFRTGAEWDPQRQNYDYALVQTTDGGDSGSWWKGP